ncbi:FmdB family zinc ribbon protein [Kocuria massiliensis]|uniref:FmdB family zinc ribbon protein n=1 Tax=Kocuria massiliensis TaxID=1926282 RepID=UPI002FD545FB
MPVYPYVCKNCQHAFDIRQTFQDDALTECPECHQGSLRKKFNTVGVSFKGSGFYSTDSKSSGASSSGSSTESTSTTSTSE